MVEAGLYRCSPSDDGCHPDASPGFFEWWYFDALFDDGSSFVSSWHVDGIDAGGRMRFAVYAPDGKKTEAAADFDASHTRVSKETCDVKMGDNYARGEFPRWEMRFREGDMGCDLTLTNLTQGVRTPPDGVGKFSEELGLYMGWVIAQPRAEVTGELILAGKRVPVHGIGYHDHNWGVGIGGVGMGNLGALWDFWYWGRLYLPRHTVVYSVGRTAPSLGHLPTRVLVALRGDTLVAQSDQIDFEEKDMITDESNGARYPRDLVIKLHDPAARGDIRLKLRKLIECSPYETGGHGYFRFLADCQAALDFDGEKVETSVPAIHELMRP